MYVPRSVAFPTSPVSADAVLLMTASVMSEFAGGGLGRMLVQGVAKDLTRRGVKAIEAFGDLRFRTFLVCPPTTCCGGVKDRLAAPALPAAAAGAEDRRVLA